MHASTRWCRRRTKEDTLERSAIASPRWTQNKLRNVRRPSINIAADQIRIQVFEISRSMNRAGQHAFSESGCETLNLRFHLLQMRVAPAVRDMAINPCRVLTVRRPRRVKQALLSEKKKWFVRWLCFPSRPFRSRNFRKCSTQMNRAGAATLFGPPGNRLPQRIVHFENSRPVTIALQ